MASNVTILYLSEADVLKAGLTFSETIDLCTKSFTEHGMKEVENPPKAAVHPKPNSFLHAMPALLIKSDLAGMKWVTGFPANMAKSLPTVPGIIVLNDTTTGFPTAIMDGTYITAIRTAAVSGVSVKYLARKDSKVLAIVGTGVQGKYNALCLTNALPSIDTIRIYDKYEPSIKSFVDQVGPALKDKVKIKVVGSAEEAISTADVVVTSTGNVKEAIFFEKWVKPGALVLPVQPRGWDGVVLTAMDKVIVDDWGQYCVYMKSLYPPLDKPYAELGEIVTGKKPGRENDQERIINFNIGLGIHDIIVANRVLEKAKASNIGVELQYMDVSSPVPLPAF